MHGERVDAYRCGGSGTTPGSLFVVVGGVPGAGKTTLIRRATAARPGVRALDSDRQRTVLSRYLRAVPYPLYRPLVHGLHYAVLLLCLLRGAQAVGTLLVHEPATRPRLRAFLSRLARRRGWHAALLLVDASSAEALAGQQQRHRVVRSRAFAGHWRRWESLRTATGDDGWVIAQEEGWCVVRRTGRAASLDCLLDLLDPVDLEHPGAAGRTTPYRLLAATRTPSAMKTVPLTASSRRRTVGRRNQAPARPTAAASVRYTQISSATWSSASSAVVASSGRSAGTNCG